MTMTLFSSRAKIDLRSSQGGVTLIESIVSIMLLSIAVAGPMTLAAHSIKASGSARNEMIATHLAEEGLEVVHSMRDNNSADDNTLGKTAWMANIFVNCHTLPGCIVDATQHQSPNVWNNTLALKPGISTVYLNPGVGLYRQSDVSLGSPWAATAFQRTILLTGIDDSLNPLRQVRVTATVTYPGYGGKTQTISIAEDLYNWFPLVH